MFEESRSSRLFISACNRRSFTAVIPQCLLGACILAFSSGSGVYASTLTLWDRSQINGVDSYLSYQEACDAYQKNILSYQERRYTQVASNQWQCLIYDPLGVRYPPYLVHLGYVTSRQISCEFGHEGSVCNAQLPNCENGTFDPNSNKCVDASENGVSNTPCTSIPNEELKRVVGNPINFVNGNKFHQEVYFSSAQPGGISFQRYYNSSDAIWRHSYSDKLTFQGDRIILSLSDGKALRFLSSGAPADAAAAASGDLRAQGSAWQFITKSQTTYDFDAQGRLVTLRLRNGSTQRLSYVVTDLSTQVFVDDDFGNQLNFKQNLKGGLYALTAANMTMSFGHANGLLVKATKTINGQQYIRQYHYEDPYNALNLTGLTDERGVRYATWRYDVQGRAISSEHTAGADKVRITYNADGSSTVVNELGKKATYRFQAIGGSKKIIAIEGEPSANCPNSNSTFTYDERGLLKTKTDNKGNLTTFDYNERGLEVSRTEAAGTPQARTVTTEWHPSLFLPVTVTEPSRITRYTYDDQGRQLSQTQTDR